MNSNQLLEQVQCFFHCLACRTPGHLELTIGSRQRSSCSLSAPGIRQPLAVTPLFLLQGHLVTLFLRRLNCLPSQAHADVGELLSRLERGCTILRVHRLFVPADRTFKIARCRVRYSEQLGDRTILSPFRSKLFFQREHPLELRLRFEVLELCLNGDRFQREFKSGLRCNSRELVCRYSRGECYFGTVAPQDPIRVSVALIRRPGIILFLVG